MPGKNNTYLIQALAGQNNSSSNCIIGGQAQAQSSYSFVGGGNNYSAIIQANGADGRSNLNKPNGAYTLNNAAAQAGLIQSSIQGGNQNILNNCQGISSSGIGISQIGTSGINTIGTLIPPNSSQNNQYYQQYTYIVPPIIGEMSLDIEKMICKIFDGLVWQKYNVDDLKTLTLEDGKKQVIIKLSKNITAQEYKNFLQSRKLLIEKISNKKKDKIKLSTADELLNLIRGGMGDGWVNLGQTIPYTYPSPITLPNTLPPTTPIGGNPYTNPYVYPYGQPTTVPYFGYDLNGNGGYLPNTGIYYTTNDGSITTTTTGNATICVNNTCIGSSNNLNLVT